MASTALKPGMVKSSGRLRKRKISKPRKRIDVSERVEPEVVSSSGVANSSQSSPRTNEADTGKVGLPWLLRAEPGSAATSEEAVRDQADDDELGVQELVTPKQENLQGYVEEEWVELGPSVHRDGHSPSYTDKAFGQNLALKTSPDSSQGNGANAQNAGSDTRQSDLDSHKNDDADVSEEMKASEGEDYKWSAPGGTKFLHEKSPLPGSTQAEVRTSGQSPSSSQLGTQAFSSHCTDRVQAMYTVWPCDHREPNVSSAVSPANVMYNCKDPARDGTNGHGSQGPYVSSTGQSTEHDGLRSNSKQSKPLLGALLCPKPILSSSSEVYEGQDVIFLAQHPRYEVPPLESQRPEDAGQVNMGATNVLSMKKTKSAGRSTAGVVSTAMPRMSGGQDFVDPTRMKFGLDDDDVTDDDPVKLREKSDRDTSDEEWRPQKINGRVRTAQGCAGLPVIKLQSETTDIKKQCRGDKSINKIVNCPTCGKHFRGRYPLLRHEMSHSEHRPFICQVCKKSFKQKAHLHGHMAVHKYTTKVEPEHDVVKPSKKVSPTRSIGRPKKIYAEDELSCKNCGKCFKTAYRLKRHEGSHTDIRPYTCKICGKGFKQTGHRNEHESNHEKDNKKCFLCNMCGVVFRCRSSFNTHMRSHKARLIRSRWLDDGDELIKQEWQEITHTGYDCPYCPDKFATAQALNNHLETHVEIKHRRHVQPYSCDVCKRTFTYRHNLIKHKLVHKAPEKYAQFHRDKVEAHVASGKPSFPCNVCAKVFIRKETLAKHSKIHSGKKPFKCSICSQTFTQNVHLKVHTRKHTGSRPFQCKECSRGFIDSTALAKHIEYEACYSENALYRCKVCGKRLQYLGSIKQHIRKQHGITQEDTVEMNIVKFERLSKRRNCGDSDKVVCKICSKCFTEKCNLVRHVRKMHSELIELLSTDKSPYCVDQAADGKYSRAAKKNAFSTVDVLTVGEEKFQVDTPGELVIDEFLGEDRAVPAPDMHRDEIKNHTSDSNAASRVAADEHTHVGYAAIKAEPRTSSDSSDKLLEGFNTAGFDCLYETAASLGAHGAFLSRAESAQRGDASPGIANEEQDNREASLHSDANFLYNIGLIVSSKRQKYKGDSNYLHDEKHAISRGEKQLQHDNSEQMSVDDRTPASALSSDIFAKQGAADKSCYNHGVPEGQNWHFMAQGTGQENSFTLISKENIFSFIKREQEESCPTIQSECINNSDLKLEAKNEFLEEASTKSFRDSPAMIVVKVGGGNEWRPPQATTERPPSYTTGQSVSCGVASVGVMEKLQEVEIKLLTPEQAREEMCIDFLETENEILKEEISDAVHGQSVPVYRNDAQKCGVNRSVGNSPISSFSLCSGSSNESSVTRTKPKATGQSSRSTSRQLHFLAHGQTTPFESPDDDYESYPTESQLKCLGLLACRDSREVVSKKCSLDMLYSTFKPWLQGLVCSSRPKRLKEKSVPPPTPPAPMATPDGISSSGAIKVKDENSSDKLVGDKQFKVVGEMISKRKSGKRQDEKGNNACQQSCSQLSAVENPSHATQQEVADLKTSADFWNDKSDPPPSTAGRADSVSYVLVFNGSPPSSVGSKTQSEHSAATYSYAASSSMAETTPPRTPPDTSTPRRKRSFSCSVCTKVFGARHQLKRHELTHTDHRPYNCDKCGRAFRQKVHLSDHTKRHQGERPFACEGCGRRFVLKNEMNQHMKHHCKVSTSLLLRSSAGRNKNPVLALALSQMAPVFLGGTASTSSAVADDLSQDCNVTFFSDKASPADLSTAQVDDASRAAATEVMPTNFIL